MSNSVAVKQLEVLPTNVVFKTSTDPKWLQSMLENVGRQHLDYH